MVDSNLRSREFPLTGKLITSEDPVIIGANFRTLKNMRYTRTNPKGIGGHSKINTTALTTFPKTRSGIHFRKEQPAESHVLIESYNAGLTASEIYDNVTAVPGAGDFVPSIFTPDTEGGIGRWSLAPNGYVAYANGEETCVWGGEEAYVGGFINYDPSDAFFRDFTAQIQNTISTGSENVATLNRVSQSTTNNMLLLHLDNNVTDNSPTTPHTVTNNNVTFSTTRVFGTHSGLFNGTTSALTVPDDGDFNFSDGTFAIDSRVYLDDFGSENILFYQKTDIEIVAFTLGTDEISAGDTLTGDTSLETAIVDFVDVTSGDWSTNDAAGSIYAHTVSGVFQAEIVSVGGTPSATIPGDFADNGDNYIKFYIDTDQKVKLVVHESYGAGTDVISMETPTINASTWYHIELDESGDDWFIFIGGQKKSVLSDASRAKNYIGLAQIGSDGTSFYDGLIDEYRISNIARHTSNFEIPSDAYSNAAGGTTATFLYVGSIMPLEGIKFYMATANTASASASVDYWDGADWQSVTSLSDGTSSGGVSLSQTGTMTFDSTASTAKVKSVNGVVIYWYRVSITALDDNVSVYHVTAKTPFQRIRDIWDGIAQKTLSFFLFDGVYNDFTGNVRNDDYDSGNAATFVNVDDLTSTQSLIAGFAKRQSGIRFNILGGAGNETANTTMSVDYWDGAGWVTVGSIFDGTSEGNISFSQSGLVSWDAVTAGEEFLTEFTGSLKVDESAVVTTEPPSLYYYRITFDKTLNNTDDSISLININSIPAQEVIGEYKFPMLALDRLWLFSDQKGQKNSSICSSVSTTNVFNGDDSIFLTWGDESEIMGATWLYSQYGASVFSVLVVFKKNETWVLIGNTPSEWRKYRISSSIGCVSPDTIRVLELPAEGTQEFNRSSVVVFQGPNGIYMTDGRPPILISKDIENLFNKREDVKINVSKISDSFSFVDVEKEEYHWCFAIGSEVDTEFVLDYSRMQWFEIERPIAIQAGIEVSDVNGATYTYGSVDTGYMLRLEHGNSFDGTAIAQEWQFGDIALHKDNISAETIAEYYTLIAESKSITTSNITVTHYGDTSISGSEITMSPTKAGFRTIRTSKHEKNGPHIYHSWKFEISTNDEVVGFEPLFFVCLYKIGRQYTKDYRS